MILIADSGSTKTDWSWIDTNNVPHFFHSEGYNPNFITREYMLEDMRKHIPTELNTNGISEIYFYGSGCSSVNYNFIRIILLELFPRATTCVVENDLVGAARALLGRNAGFAAILGTGMNSCIFDGERIVKIVDGLGFLLGDEGSGDYLGKCLISDYLRENMPTKVNRIVAARIAKNNDEVIEQLYTKPFPNRYCAQFSLLIKEHLETDPYFVHLVERSFRDLFRNVISHYPNFTDYQFNCVGSVGFVYADILERVAREFDMKLGKVIKSPMDGLVEFFNTK